jgi:hypothetical protein
MPGHISCFERLSAVQHRKSQPTLTPIPKKANRIPSSVKRVIALGCGRCAMIKTPDLQVRELAQHESQFRTEDGA